MGESSRLYLIAEAGATHTGLQSAMNLVDMAIDCGFDAIKFQMVQLERINPDEKFGKYRLEDILKQRLLKIDEWEELNNYIGDRIEWFVTTTLFSHVDWAEKHNMRQVKICSRDLTNLELIKYASKKIDTVHLDTGGGSFFQIDEAENEIVNHVIIHHCPVGYPSNPENENLRRIKELKEEFECQVGYSSHTASLEMDVMAVALGADVLEVPIKEQFSSSISPEEKYALTAEQATNYVQTIRKCERAL